MEEVTKVLPAIALRGTTILPDMIVHFDISRPKSVRAVEEAMLGDQKIFLITQKDLRRCIRRTREDHRDETGYEIHRIQQSDRPCKR